MFESSGVSGMLGEICVSPAARNRLPRAERRCGQQARPTRPFRRDETSFERMTSRTNGLRCGGACPLCLSSLVSIVGASGHHDISLPHWKVTWVTARTVVRHPRYQGAVGRVHVRRSNPRACHADLKSRLAGRPTAIRNEMDQRTQQPLRAEGRVLRRQVALLSFVFDIGNDLGPGQLSRRAVSNWQAAGEPRVLGHPAPNFGGAPRGAERSTKGVFFEASRDARPRIRRRTFCRGR